MKVQILSFSKVDVVRESQILVTQSHWMRVKTSQEEFRDVLYGGRKTPRLVGVLQTIVLFTEIN